jgi:hypothetical protein
VRGLEAGPWTSSQTFQPEEVVARVTHLTVQRLRPSSSRNAEFARELHVAQEMLADARAAG